MKYNSGFVYRCNTNYIGYCWHQIRELHMHIHWRWRLIGQYNKSSCSLVWQLSTVFLFSYCWDLSYHHVCINVHVNVPYMLNHQLNTVILSFFSMYQYVWILFQSLSQYLLFFNIKSYCTKYWVCFCVIFVFLFYFSCLLFATRKFVHVESTNFYIYYVNELFCLHILIYVLFCYINTFMYYTHV